MKFHEDTFKIIIVKTLLVK